MASHRTLLEVQGDVVGRVHAAGCSTLDTDTLCGSRDHSRFAYEPSQDAVTCRMCLAAADELLASLHAAGLVQPRKGRK